MVLALYFQSFPWPSFPATRPCPTIYSSNYLLYPYIKWLLLKRYYSFRRGKEKTLLLLEKRRAPIKATSLQKAKLTKVFQTLMEAPCARSSVTQVSTVMTGISGTRVKKGNYKGYSKVSDNIGRGTPRSKQMGSFIFYFRLWITS